ncbi:MAG: methyltransferase FkbM family [Candidatus Nomurabacteria bacterium]|nr:methyltransferase FkbM family [Candidatus Nomurabacteria bacterium]
MSLLSIKSKIPENYRVVLRKLRNRVYRFCDLFLRELTSRTYYGYRVYYPKGCGIIDRVRFLAPERTYEPEIINLLNKNTKSKNPVFIDVGANIGLISIAYLYHHPQTEIIAFEPGPVQRFCFGATIVANKLEDRITLKEIALSNKIGHANFVTHGSVHNSGDGFIETNRMVSGENVITVKTSTLDEELSPLKIQKIDFIKIDVEGSEMYVLEGARETIEKFKPIIVLEMAEKNLSSYQITFEEMFSYIEKINYALFTIEEVEIHSSKDLKVSGIKNDMFIIKPRLN